MKDEIVLDEAVSNRFDNAEFHHDGGEEIFRMYASDYVNWNKVAQFIAQELQQATLTERKRLISDMKSKMYNWHGRGNKMVDDYKRITPSTGDDRAK